MKKLFKLFSYVFFFLFILLLTLPKENVYYFFEKELKKYNIVFSNEKIKESFFSLELSSIDVGFNKSSFSSVDEIDFAFYVFYNTLEINTINIKKGFIDSYPSKIEKVYLSYSIFSPSFLSLKAHGNFGKVEGTFSFLSKRLKLKLDQSTLMDIKYKNILQEMKKEKKGYSYEYQL